MVTCHTGADYVKSTVKWQIGDILVSDTHVIVVASGASPSGSSVTAAAASIDKMAQAVIAGRYGNGNDRRVALGDKYEAVQKRVNELLHETVNAAGTSTGATRIIAGTYRVAFGSLNVRSASGLSGSVVAGYGRGERIYSIGADVVTADGYVWAHYTTYSGATRYAAIGAASGSEKYSVKVRG